MSDIAEIVETHDQLALDASEARELTRQIKVALEHSYTLIIAAYRGRAWQAMGFSSWDAYCQTEFGDLALQPPREERQAVVMSMREAGMSIRAISEGTNLGRGTVERELASSRIPKRIQVSQLGHLTLLLKRSFGLLARTVSLIVPRLRRGLLVRRCRRSRMFLSVMS